MSQRNAGWQAGVRKELTMRMVPECSSAVNASDVTGLAYLASPKPTFGTPRHRRMLARAQRLFPQAEVLPASGVFESNEDWRARWTAVLASLSALVFFPEVDGSIGLGVSQEVADARAASLPVFLLTDAGELLADGAFNLEPHPLLTARHFERVTLAGG